MYGGSLLCFIRKTWILYFPTKTVELNAALYASQFLFFEHIFSHCTLI
jgi:hypothetical protein